MKRFKKALSLLVCLTLMFTAFSITALAQAPAEAPMAQEDIQLIDGGVLASYGKSIDVWIEGGSGVTYIIYTPEIFNVDVSFTRGSTRFALQIDDAQYKVWHHIFDNNQFPLTYYEKGAGARYGTMKLTVFNDSPYGSQFVGTVNFTPYTGPIG